MSRGQVCEMCVREARTLALDHGGDWTDYIAVVEARNEGVHPVDTVDVRSRVLLAVTLLLAATTVALLAFGQIVGIL